MKAARLLLRLPRARSSPRGIVRTNLAAPQYPYSTSAKEWPYESQYPLCPSLSHRTAEPEYEFAATDDLSRMDFSGAIPRA